MFSAKINNFRKGADCPSSEELVAFQNALLSPRDEIDIQRHVIDCEFCESELELYSNCPPQIEDDFDTAASAAEIPHALYELAEALLEKRYADNSLLNKLLEADENEKVSKF